jgi:predicted ester cyclase
MSPSVAAVGAGTTIEELIGRYQRREVPRKRVIAALTAAGASAALAASIVNSAENAKPVGQSLAPSHHQVAGAVAVDPAEAHARHVAGQVGVTAAATSQARRDALHKIVGDYSPNAVVNDPLFGAPLTGTAAIAVHKAAEAAAMSNVTLNILTRVMLGDQLVSTWEMTGTHVGQFYGYAPTGARISVTGTTVHTRGRDGRITTETLYYDAADVHRQLSGG